MERQVARTVAAVLVLAFVLLSIWAGYFLLSELRGSSSSVSTPLADYLMEGRGNFTAALRPNDLCNCTQATGGNSTLFPAITQTINVTLATSTSVSAPATIVTTDVFAVSLSTAAWSKPIYVALNHTSLATGAPSERVDEYSVNVSQIMALISFIDGQLNYQTTQAWLTLTSTVVSTITVQGISDSPGSTTTANLRSFHPRSWQGSRAGRLPGS